MLKQLLGEFYLENQCFQCCPSVAKKKKKKAWGFFLLGDYNANM
jgi:hypothetical protein